MINESVKIQQEVCSFFSRILTSSWVPNNTKEE